VTTTTTSTSTSASATVPPTRRALPLEPAAPPASRTLRRRLLRRLAHHRFGLAGGALVLLIVLAAVAAPLVAPHDPDQVNLALRTKPPGTPGYLLGTDIYGRDLLSRLIWGGRVSLTMGLAAMALSASVGITFGILAGYLGGRLDTLIMRVVDVMLAFPYILLAIVIVATLGPGLLNTMLAIGIAGIAFYVRVMRGVVVSTREEVFVEATRALGASDVYIMHRTILPALVPYIIVVCSLNVGFLILEAASLSFLGLGAQPPTPEWGAMLAEARQYVTVAPHVVLIPGLMILLVVIGLNVLGDALRDVLDVHLQEQT
jgi:peptide/nickel transport system permease protein